MVFYLVEILGSEILPDRDTWFLVDCFGYFSWWRLLQRFYLVRIGSEILLGGYF